MRRYILIGLILITISISGCTVAPAEINEQIAEVYRGLNSLSYDVEIVREDIYEKPYTVYELERIEEPPYVAVGKSKTLTGCRHVWSYSIFIEKPDKKAVTGTYSHDDTRTGGQEINGTWYNELKPAKTHESRYVCNGDEYSVSVYGETGIPLPEDFSCQKWVQSSIWEFPATLDDPTKFNVDITTETIDGEEVIKASVESATGEFFYVIKNVGMPVDYMIMPFHKVVFWFRADDYRVVKFEGVLEKSKTGTGTQVGLSNNYTMNFKNMVFNPDIPPDTFTT
jgi:hypothetical protein